MIKTEKKDSEKPFCVLLIHLTEFQLSLKKPFAKGVLEHLESIIFKPLEGYGEKGNIFS